MIERAIAPTWRETSRARAVGVRPPKVQEKMAAAESSRDCLLRGHARAAGCPRRYSLIGAMSRLVGQSRPATGGERRPFFRPDGIGATARDVSLHVGHVRPFKAAGVLNQHRDVGTMQQRNASHVRIAASYRNDRFDVVRVRKHVDCLHAVDVVARLADGGKLPRKSLRVARNVDHTAGRNTIEH
jgi:hypothetical protein